MSKVAHKAGFISTEGIRALTWTTPTTATIWWEGGLIGTFEFDEWGAECMKSVLEHDAAFSQDALAGFKEHGLFWQDWLRFEFQERMKDHEHQRAKLREQGLYESHIEAGRYTLRVESEDGKSSWSQSGKINPSGK